MKTKSLPNEALTLESVVMELAETLEREHDVARDVEQALSYMMFFDAIESEFKKAA